MESSPVQDSARHAAVRQYSLAQILGVWAAAALPMGVLAWIVAPWLRDQLGGDDPFAEALLICITAGLIWQFVLVLILIRREPVDSNGRASARHCGCESTWPARRSGSPASSTSPRRSPSRAGCSR